MTKGSRRGCIALKKAILGIDDEEESTFTIHVDGRTFHFQGRQLVGVSYNQKLWCYHIAQNSEERERWMQALDTAIKRLLQPVKVSSQQHRAMLAMILWYAEAGVESTTGEERTVSGEQTSYL